MKLMLDLTPFEFRTLAASQKAFPISFCCKSSQPSNPTRWVHVALYQSVGIGSPGRPSVVLVGTTLSVVVENPIDTLKSVA